MNLLKYLKSIKYNLAGVIFKMKFSEKNGLQLMVSLLK